jgi:hypothetical protein
MSFNTLLVLNEIIIITFTKHNFLKMKHTKILLFVAFSALITLTSCFKDAFVRKTVMTANTPVYMSYDEFRSSVRVTEPQELVNPGKIYIYGDLIFVNEFEKGFHIFDNTNPQSPQKIAYVEIPGNVDLIVKEGCIYADSYIDLVVLNAHDLTNIKEVSRLNDVFTYVVPSMNTDYPCDNIDKTQGVVVGWEVKEITKKCSGNDCDVMRFDFNNDFAFGDQTNATAQFGFAGASLPTVTNTTNKVINRAEGVSGSMAKFNEYNDYLYAVANQTDIHVFDISDRENPVLVNTLENFGTRVETVFITNNTLYVGTNNGVLFYHLTSPDNPEYAGRAEHFVGCDPVVANETRTYVTVRSARTCGWVAQSVLNVYDTENLSDWPTQLNSINIEEPYGLSLANDSKNLIVCNGSFGINVYNTEELDVQWNFVTPAQVVESNGVNFDVITIANRVYSISTTGLTQFDLAESGELTKLSEIVID